MEPGDPWPTDPMLVRRTPADADRTAEDSGRPPTFRNRASHWWDGSQIYGSDNETTASLCSFADGRLLIGETDRLLAIDPLTGFDRSGFTDNWWVGLSLLHTLFTLEHNAILERLRVERPDWTGEQLFSTARLVNVALMAKIHTVEWTPAILAHPTLKLGMNANWWGLAGERLHHLLSRVSRNEVIRGIPGTATDHHGVPFSLTEEFVAVYRLHPLLPDSIRFASATDGRFLKELAFPDVAFERARAVLDGTTSMADVAYSLGIAHPGAVVLHNYPTFLCHLTMPDGQLLDLGAIDVLRDRERGVPRYNQFRRLVHCRPATTFDDITSNRQWAAELAEVYGDVERVDLMVGTLAEDRPKGFGFSDTAFRIFVLMASRRLNSDRFFTTDYTAEVYTKAGLDWVNSNTMKTVLLRHYPELAPAVGESDNAFAPWKPIGSGDGAGGDDPFGRLPGDPGDELEVVVVVKDHQVGRFGRGGDEEIGDLRAPMLAAVRPTRPEPQRPGRGRTGPWPRTATPSAPLASLDAPWGSGRKSRPRDRSGYSGRRARSRGAGGVSPRPRVGRDEPAPKCRRGSRASAPRVPAGGRVDERVGLDATLGQEGLAALGQGEDLVERLVDGRLERAGAKKRADGVELVVVDLDEPLRHLMRISDSKRLNILEATLGWCPRQDSNLRHTV